MRLSGVPSKLFDIVVYLLQTGESNVKKIIDDLRIGRGTFYSAIRKAADLGFVYERKRKGWPAYSFYGLTRKGEELAQSLLPVKRIVDNTIMGYESELKRLRSRKRTENRVRKELDLLNKLKHLKFDRGEWRDAIRFSKGTIELGEEVSDSASVANGHRVLGYVHQCRSKYQDALGEFKKSLEVSKESYDSKGLAEDSYYLGAVLERLGKYDKAMVHYQESLDFSERHDYEVTAAKARLGVGRVLGKKGDYSESMREMKVAIRELEKLKEYGELPLAYANAGATALHISTMDCLKWNEKCIEASRKHGNVRMLGYGLANGAGCLIQRKEYKKAGNNLEQALAIFKRLREKVMISSVYVHYGGMRRLQRRWRESEEYFERAISVLEKLGDEYALADAFFQFGKVYRDRGDVKRANIFFGKSKSIFGEIRSRDKVEKLRKEIEKLNP